jgi:hypothetical protein
MSPENMIEQVLAGGDDYELLWNLIGAVRDGFSIEKMRPLLSSDDPRVTAIAAYLAYELGAEMQPLLGELIPLADHPEPQCRSDIVHALIECAGPNDLDALSRIMLASDDPEPFIHRAAIQFVIVADGRSLANAVSEAVKRYPGTPFEDIFVLLRNGGKGHFFPDWGRIGKGKLRQFIQHPAPIVRRFGVGLAARPKLVVDAEFLEIARDCHDAEGLIMLDHISRRPKPTGARIAKLAFIEEDHTTGTREPCSGNRTFHLSRFSFKNSRKPQRHRRPISNAD